MKFSESLKKNKDFQIVYRTGNSLANRSLVMYKKENGLGKNRLGISVSKKVGNSVVRHHLTRLIGFKKNISSVDMTLSLWSESAQKKSHMQTWKVR